jgi:EAL domain-containing protein (putative c-di-GMP-specific phosphodiesterase class I)
MRRFAFDKIKIDRSFLASLEGSGESALIVQTIVHFAKALGLRVVAEGIETEEQFRLVTASGCGELQGFYFSPAVPPGEIVQMLEGGLSRAA